MAFHPTADVVMTGDAHGRIEQWIILSQCAPPAWAIEEVDRANMQHAPDPPLRREYLHCQVTKLTTPVDAWLVCDVENGSYTALAFSPSSDLSIFF